MSRAWRALIGKGAAMLAQACAHGLEGIVSKRVDAPYRTDRPRAEQRSCLCQRRLFFFDGLPNCVEDKNKLTWSGNLAEQIHLSQNLKFARLALMPGQ